MMKRILFFLFLILCLGELRSQQIPLYSQYTRNRFLYNPAYTGFEPQGSVQFIYRRQWTDFEGAPETRALTFDMPINKIRAGIGAYFYSDNTDIFRRLGGYLSYSYHINFNAHTRLSIGLAAGVQDLRIDFERVFVRDYTDKVLTFNDERSAAFDGSAGVNFHFKGWDLGVSVPQLVGTNQKYVNTKEQTFYQLERHFLASTQYDIKLAQDKFHIIPAFLFRTPNFKFNNIQFDAGATFMYKDWVWVNAMYRYDYAVSIGGGFKVHDLVSVGYSYDLPINDLSDYAGQTHEFMLGIHFGGRGKGGAELSEEEKQRMQEMYANQDSIIRKMYARMDSMQHQIDSLNGILAKGFEMDVVGGEMVDTDGDGVPDTKVGGSTLSDMEKRLRDIESQINAKLNQLKTEVDKTTQIQREMQEERTRIVDESDLEFKRGTELGDFFMVVGSFRIEANAYAFQDDLTRKGWKPGVVYDKKRKWYYVYLSQPKDYKQGLEELFKLREENKEFHDAWIHIMSKRIR